jgi:hypothetical protein
MYFPKDQNFNLIDDCVKRNNFQENIIKRITKNNIIIWCEKTGYRYPTCFYWSKEKQLLFLRKQYIENLNATRKFNQVFLLK